MDKNHAKTIRQQVDELAALCSQLHGIAECLEAISYRYEPGEDIGFAADATAAIAADLNTIAGTLEDTLWGETRSLEGSM